MFLKNSSNIILNEMVFMCVSGLVFVSFALYCNNVHALLLMFGCILTMHYYSAALFDEKEVAIFPLICLFGTYLIFSAIFSGWVSLLLLPYLLNIHILRKYSKYSSWLIILLLPNLLFVVIKIIEIYAFGTGTESNIQKSWLGVVFLTVNAVISLAVKYAIDSISDEANNYRNAISLATINELSERAAKRELIIKQYVIERNIRLEERELISLSIHNAVGHTMSAAITSLDVTKALYEIDPVLAKEKLIVARGCVSQGLDFVRHAVRIIDNDDDTISSSDVVSALVAHIEHFNSVSKVVTSHNLANFDICNQIPRIQGEFFINTLLELLSNSRHGDATVCSVTFYANDTQIRLTVSDNGTVFSRLSEKERSERLKNGFGLRKIEKHVERFGGAFRLTCIDGFTVEITIPIIKE